MDKVARRLDVNGLCTRALRTACNHCLGTCILKNEIPSRSFLGAAAMSNIGEFLMTSA
jgi:hypothetical protein